MKDHGQQARASENFAGPVDFETPRLTRASESLKTSGPVAALAANIPF